jgi:spore germination protein GerM
MARGSKKSRKFIYFFIGIIIIAIGATSFEVMQKNKENKAQGNSFTTEINSKESTDSKDTTENKTSNNTATNNKSTDTSKKSKVKLYLTNNEYVKNGDEAIQKLLSEDKEIDFTNSTKEKATLEALIKEKATNDKMYNIIPSNAKLISFDIKDKIAYVNFENGDINKGSSLIETMMVCQIVKTLTQFDTIDKVQFKIDSKETASLQGHLDVSKPLGKEFLSNLGIK